MSRVGILISRGLNYFHGFNSLLAMLSGACIMTAMLIMSYEVIMRYFFDSPTTWVAEISIYLVIAALFIPQAYAQQTGQHVRMDFIYLRLSKRWQGILDTVSTVVGLGLWIIFSWSIYKYTLRALDKKWTTGTTLDSPMWPILMAMTAGAILFCLALLATFRMNIINIIGLFFKQGDQQIESQANNIEEDGN